MIKLKDLHAAAVLAENRDDMIRFTNLLARPKARVPGPRDEDRSQAARRPGTLLKRDLHEDRFIELHEDFVGVLPRSVVIRIVDMVNSLAQTAMDKQLQEIDTQLTNLGVNTR